jgi:hypothetical protein
MTGLPLSGFGGGADTLLVDDLEVRMAGKLDFSRVALLWEMLPILRRKVLMLQNVVAEVASRVPRHKEGVISLS